MDIRSWQSGGGSRILVLTGSAASDVRELVLDYPPGDLVIMDVSAMSGDQSSLVHGIVVAMLKRQRHRGGRLACVGRLPPEVESSGLKKLMRHYATLELALAGQSPDEGLSGVREPRRPLPPNDQFSAERSGPH